MGDVFISYSRHNVDFTRRLYEALTAHGHDAWVDWNDIPQSSAWWHEIRAGIENADSFLVVMSPAYWEAPYNMLELDHAIQNNKRLIPIMYEEFTPEEIFGRLAVRSIDEPLRGILSGRDLLAIARRNWQQIALINWLSFREQDDFDNAIQNLLAAVSTDIDHVRTHTRLLIRASEWEQNNRNLSYLLRGTDLIEAENWLAQSVKKTPSPTDLHAIYITASRQALRKRQRRILIAISMVLIVMSTLSLLSLELFRQSENQRTLAEDQAQTITALETLVTMLQTLAPDQIAGINELRVSATSVALKLEQSENRYNALLIDLMGVAATHGAEVTLPPPLQSVQGDSSETSGNLSLSKTIIIALITTSMIGVVVFIAYGSRFLMAFTRRSQGHPAITSQISALSDARANVSAPDFEIELSRHSVFVSYSRSDWDEYVYPLVMHLKENGFKVWVDQHLLRGGQNWRDEIGRAVDTCERMVLCISPSSMDSIWVKFEYQGFFPKKQSLVPILCRPTDPLPFDLRGLQYIKYKDFGELVSTLKRMAPREESRE